VHFLQNLPAGVTADRLRDLDGAFRFTTGGNAEVLAVWLERAIAARYEPAMLTLERFLLEVGRRKFLRPLYSELAKTPEGLERARAIYAKARPGYHSVATGTIDAILKWEPSSGGAGAAL
jgi:hypothetical protein